MLVILEATTGPVAGRKIEVRAGSTLRVGRTPKSDYAIAEDSYLSGQHFSVECDGMLCRIRDLGSSNGTFVNGDRVTETIIKEGDSLVAGVTTFAVHIAASAPPPSPAPIARAQTATYTSSMTRLDRPAFGAAQALQWPGFSRAQSVLLNALYHDGEIVFAVLDPLRDSRIPAFLEASGERFAALGGAAGVAAYIVAIPLRSRLLDVLLKDGWSRGWGFYCTARAGLEEAFAHLQGYVTLRSEHGRTLLFRFWDPRLMRLIVPAMAPSEAADFFGPLARLIVEGERPEMAIEFSLTSRGTKQEELVLV